SDAHNQKIKLGPITILTIGAYYHSFKCINMHVLLDKKLSHNFTTDKNNIYNALKSGHSWVSYDYFINSKGFRFILKTKSKTYLIGSRVNLELGMFFIIKLPKLAKLLVIKDGEVWRNIIGDYFVIKVEEIGVYRLEVYHQYGKSWRPWIFTNSFWLV
ncbi:MAG: hypothetical protein GX333_03260, partial [Syntrophomonadaceae bacterium]|nr:hypothetical protein [Syntrophomonadaceae bacterium]